MSGFGFAVGVMYCIFLRTIYTSMHMKNCTGAIGMIYSLHFFRMES